MHMQTLGYHAKMCLKYMYVITQNKPFLCFTYIFYVKRVEIVNGIYDKQIITWGFGYRLQYQPSTIISPRAKALGLIMGSHVDTSGDNQNDMR